MSDPMMPEATTPAEAPLPEMSQSRRAFFGRAAKLTAAPAALVLASRMAQAAGTTKGPLPSLYPGQTGRLFAEIRADENDHVQFIESLLGSNARPAPAFKNLTIPTNNPLLFAATSSVFENTGAMTYLGGLPYIQSQAIVMAAGSIAQVEGYHSGWLDSLINFPLTPNGVTRLVPFTQAETFQNVAPYLADPTILPSYAISTTPSPQNDIAILNFALLLERLEQTFYNINVQAFFGI